MTHFGIDITDAGFTPTTWRQTGAKNTHEFDAGRLAAFAGIAKRGLFDFITIDHSPHRFDQFQSPAGALDTLRIAAQLGALTDDIGIHAALTPAVCDRGQLSSAITQVAAKVGGRLGLQLTPHEDVTAREAITPRKPSAWDIAGQFGNELRANENTATTTQIYRVESPAALEVAAQHADVIRISAHTIAEATDIRTRINAALEAVGRDPRTVPVLLDFVVLSAQRHQDAIVRSEFWEELNQNSVSLSYQASKKTATYIGDNTGLVTEIAGWLDSGSVDGFTFLAAALPTDFHHLADALVPALQELGRYRNTFADEPHLHSVTRAYAQA